MVTVRPCYDEQVADHSPSKRQPNPFSIDGRDNLSDELRRATPLRKDDTVGNSICRVGNTVEDEAVSGVSVRGSYLGVDLLRGISARCLRERWIVVPEPAQGSRERSRCLNFMSCGVGGALRSQFRTHISCPYNMSSPSCPRMVLRGSPEHSERCKDVSAIWCKPRELFVAIVLRCKHKGALTTKWY